MSAGRNLRAHAFFRGYFGRPRYLYAHASGESDLVAL